MKVILIRHPAPAIATGICYGASDLALREAAHLQAAATFASYAAWGMPDALITSPLQRCAQFANALAAHLPNTLAWPDARLRELNFGRWELQTWDAIGAGALDAWIASDYAAVHGGESLAALDARVADWLDHLPTQHQCLWVVTHAGVMRSVLRQRAGLSLANSHAWPLDYAQALALHMTPSGTTLLETSA